MNDLAPLWISLRSATIASVFVLIFGLLAARVTLSASKKLSLFLDTLFTFPMVLPPTVLGFFFLVILGRNSPIGNFLYAYNIHILFTWVATVIAAIAVAFPLMYRGAKGAFEQVNQEHIWAARTLGMSELSIFFKIIIPESIPVLCASLALSFMRALGEFGATMMIAGNIPQKTQTIPMAIYFSVSNGDMRTATIWVIIICAISFLSLIIINLLNNKGRS
ncbi:MAG: molybdate ABC transporter permease subunit [Treponemataceae bacterium]